MGGDAWSYDANGNLVAKSNFTLAWDSLDRLTAVNGPNNLHQMHIFDQAGTRVVKQVMTPQGTQTVLYPDPKVEVRGDRLVKYIFAGTERIAEVRTPFRQNDLIVGFAGAPALFGFASDHDGHITIGAIAGRGGDTGKVEADEMADALSIFFAHTEDADPPLDFATISAALAQYGVPGAASLDAVSTPQTQVFFYHSDHLGSASVIVDGQGSVVERISYYPYGTERSASDNASVAYRFTGKEQDLEIGLYNYGARFYDAHVGRFLSIDPVYEEQPARGEKSPQYLNVYAYALNNPTRYRDPTGMDPKGSEKAISSKAEYQAGSWSGAERGGGGFAFGKNIGLTGETHVLKADWGLGISEGKEGISAGPKAQFTMLQTTGTIVGGGKELGVYTEGEVNLNKAGAQIGLEDGSLGGSLELSVMEGKVSGGVNVLGKRVGIEGEARLGVKVGIRFGKKIGIDAVFFSLNIDLGSAKEGPEEAKLLPDPCFNSGSSACVGGSEPVPLPVEIMPMEKSLNNN